MIKKTKSGYQVESKHSGKNLGKFKTRLEAVRRLQQVEYFKRKKKGKASLPKGYPTRPKGEGDHEYR